MKLEITKVLNHLESTSRQTTILQYTNAGLCKNGVHATSMAHITNTAPYGKPSGS